ncbi:hypothetical protein [Aminobacter sp. BE322]|uniref:hypothetical protein n=1 Tax=unclassified Aminobacter TaxID=2644704 RepID=UPI003D1BB82E
MQPMTDRDQFLLSLELEETARTLRGQLGGLFPTPPWPRAEMLALARHIATETGVPELCADPMCRRGRLCRAETIAEGGPPCAASWSGGALARLEGGFEALALGWMMAERRQAALRDAASAAAVEPVKRRPRERRRR